MGGFKVGVQGLSPKLSQSENEKHYLIPNLNPNPNSNPNVNPNPNPWKLGLVKTRTEIVFLFSDWRSAKLK